jgi:hypothetical protein
MEMAGARGLGVVLVAVGKDCGMGKQSNGMGKKGDAGGKQRLFLLVFGNLVLGGYCVF